MKVIPGYRHFECECGLAWRARTRDCHSPSNEACPECCSWAMPVTYEEHPEWPRDASGNIENNDGIEVLETTV